MSRNDINLYQFEATPTDIVLRTLQSDPAATGTTIYLLEGADGSNDIVLFKSYLEIYGPYGTGTYGTAKYNARIEVDGASDSASSTSFVGASVFAAVTASSCGSPTASVGVSVFNGVFSSSGSSSDTAIGVWIAKADGSTSCVSTCAFVGVLVFLSLGSSSGAAEALGVYEETFPHQYLGLKAFFGGVVNDLCLVAEEDAPSGMGGVLKVRKNGANYAVYLVETNDANASPIYIHTSTGVKAIRLKT